MSFQPERDEHCQLKSQRINGCCFSHTRESFYVDTKPETHYGSGARGKLVVSLSGLKLLGSVLALSQFTLLYFGARKPKSPKNEEGIKPLGPLTVQDISVKEFCEIWPKQLTFKVSVMMILEKPRPTLEKLTVMNIKDKILTH